MCKRNSRILPCSSLLSTAIRMRTHRLNCQAWGRACIRYFCRLCRARAQCWQDIRRHCRRCILCCRCSRHNSCLSHRTCRQKHLRQSKNQLHTACMCLAKCHCSLKCTDQQGTQHKQCRHLGRLKLQNSPPCTDQEGTCRSHTIHMTFQSTRFCIDQRGRDRNKDRIQ